ncbi:Peptidase S46 [Pirellula sp. SH-Sr6A]|uniref:S46 family peptidase n=1 Tax=Pirellula sp. SH-Sr6A TaxID=1632865 RepID=UPI00078EC1A1|nr:S46 family peptidase [Pirellula sp. SH-Sr6A]AMV31034.1 Peptidase S46 [Pirellula sp. SH-Sr6A]
MRLRTWIRIGISAAIACSAWGREFALADEGMWLFNAVPKTELKKKYGFEPTQEWLDHLMLSSVRFNSGGSASFVSSNGLVLTNHHVASDTLYKLSTAEHNYNEDGFLAKSQAEEIKAPDLELNQLISIEDVTARVNSAVAAGLSPQDAAKARQAAMAQIEKESLDKTGLRSDVVTLFGGGKYHLYRYMKYTDVRLVWAPEAGSAFFGGDADNFEYPRYCLDVTLFRVYENGKPAKIEHFLKMDPNGAKENDLVFVSGNPGRTRRIFTHSAIEFQRDHSMPRTMNYLRRKEILMQQYGLTGPEQKRRAKDDLFGIQNSRKAIGGMLAGLQDPAFATSKKKEESALRENVSSDPKLKPFAGAWQQIEQSQAKRKELLTQSVSLRTKLYGVAETLVLMAIEDTKASAERFREYRDSNRESFLQELYSDAPMYDDLERIQLADELARLSEDRGGNDPFVRKALQEKGPKDRASELIGKTELFSVEGRKKIAAAGLEGLKKSTDPMIQLALAMEPEYRRVRELTDSIDETERQAYAKITEAKFAVAGDTLYPDATFTLRLSYGQVKGYESNGGTVPAATTLAGAFDHESKHLAEEPWILPKSWKSAKDNFNGSAPFNFVCTADIIGGNSGSPVVSKEGAMVGIIFDGNIESLTADFYYTDQVSRAVSVHIAGVLEAMRKIYDAGHLADEMGK